MGMLKNRRAALYLVALNQPEGNRAAEWLQDRLFHTRKALDQVCPGDHPDRDYMDFSMWFNETVENRATFLALSHELRTGAFSVFDMFGYWWKGTYCTTGADQ